MPENKPGRDLTSRFAGEPYLENNGLGSYSVVREGPNGKQTLQVAPELKTVIIQDMQAKRAGGRFGQEDDGMWYPIALHLAQQIPGWEQPITPFDVCPTSTPRAPRQGRRR